MIDLGTNGPESVDYPEFGAKLAARRSRSGEAERGIAVCGSGIGISIAVNRNPTCRCARVDDPLSAQLAREHNDANVLALGARLIGGDMATPASPPSSAPTSPAGATSAASTSFPPSCRIPTDGHVAARRSPTSSPTASSPGSLADADPAVADGDRRRADPRADPDRADRVGEHRQRAPCSRRRARC